MPRSPLLLVATALAFVGCGSLLPGSTAPNGNERLQQQAQAALVRWANAVSAAKQPGVVIVGELTSQVGDWEEPVGENNKVALMAGAVQPAASLPLDVPAQGEVRWPDGRTSAVDLTSAAQALDSIVAGGSGCSDCRPLLVTAARLTTGPLETSRGPATAPVWEFTLQGTNVRVTRVAIANAFAVVPPAWDPNNAPEGISINSALGAADARRLTVSFTGTPGRGDEACGADYSAEAVESEVAIVVIVTEHRNPMPGACSAVGAQRIALVDLAAPLGDRTVLEVRQGLPVPVLQP